MAQRVRLRASEIAAAIITLAFFVRLYRLPDKNIWWDEGWTIWLSRFDLASISLRTASDEHPPLHYWLMHFWDLVVGAGASSPRQADAFVGRFFSVFFGVLTVAMSYRLGKKIGGQTLGLVAALLLALARFHVWWSQDIKNYTLSGFFALVSVWFVLQMTDSRWQPGDSKPSFTIRDSPFAIGYVLSITLALYSHYLAGLIFLANNLFVGVVLLQLWRAERASTGERATTRVAPTNVSTANWATTRIASTTIRWVLVQIAVLGLFAPWLALYLRNGATWTAAPTFDFGIFLRLVATVLPLGVTTYIENYTAIVLIFTVLVALGAGWLVSQRANFGLSIPYWCGFYDVGLMQRRAATGRATMKVAPTFFSPAARP